MTHSSLLVGFLSRVSLDDGEEKSVGQRVQTDDFKVLQTAPPGRCRPVAHRLLILHNQRQMEQVKWLVGDPQRTEVV